METNSNLIDILDLMVEDLTTQHPTLSEERIALAVLRQNMQALIESLLPLAVIGGDLPNLGLMGLIDGLMQTHNWIASNELAGMLMDDIEREGL